MVSFFSHGFGSGGSASKQGKKKKEEKGTWVPIVDGRGQTINWQNSETGFYYYAPFAAAAPMQQHVVGGAFVPQPMAQPMAQQVQPVFQAGMPWGGNVVPMAMPPLKWTKEKKDKENEAGYWDSFRDEKGVRYYKHSRTHKITYIDPYK